MFHSSLVAFGVRPWHCLEGRPNPSFLHEINLSFCLGLEVALGVFCFQAMPPTATMLAGLFWTGNGDTSHFGGFLCAIVNALLHFHQLRVRADPQNYFGCIATFNIDAEKCYGEGHPWRLMAVISLYDRRTVNSVCTTSTSRLVASQ